MGINDEFLNQLNSKLTELGLNKKELATEQYKNKLSSLKGNSKAINSEQQVLRGDIDILMKKVAQYENNISFFGSGKATGKLFEEAQEQIDNTRAEIEDLKEKIQLLNKA